MSLIIEHYFYNLLLIIKKMDKFLYIIYPNAFFFTFRYNLKLTLLKIIINKNLC